MTTYRDAGVDIDAGEETVRRIKPLVRQTFTPGVLADIGAFGSFFELDLRAFKPANLAYMRDITAGDALRSLLGR